MTMMMLNMRTVGSVRKKKHIKNNDPGSDPSGFFSVGSTIARQYEDERPWMHEMIVEANGSDHKGVNIPHGSQ